ncbi:HlyD family efflux transporter periplasmic adaptor subunit [Paenibacillus flagellatus]|uniref:Efflux transporter periplasmic adaptor subunit n=1 Tax=Paenibacillus flagellatus TaxID=2211139 RepID=A0A2V5K0Z7_9BACL|nr:HlyD family efflux transporter periplasmic adaptor subunit [Paenibacillus flagellatus]PYI51374.1 efflux transporter periplasmic adaptor subunit [Paenibacillus flagellatus]
MSWKRKTKWTLAIAAVIVSGGGGTYWYITGANRPAATAQAAESTATVQKGNIRLSVSGTSQFQTQRMQNITAPADGVIRTMNLTRSQPVKQGDVLLQLSDSATEASLKDAQTTLAKLQQDLDELLNEQQSLRIVAPGDGKLTLGANIDVGSSISQSAKVGTVSANATLTVKLLFPVEEAAPFAAGTPVDLAVAGYALSRTGTVKTVGTEWKPDASGNRLVEVEVEVANDGTLDAGLDASGSVAVGGRELKSTATAKLEYAKTVALLSETSGTVVELKKKTGDVVRAGETIALIANDTLPASIASKQNEIARQMRTVDDLQKRVDELTVIAPFDGVFSTDFANQKTNVLANFPVGASVEAGALFGAVASLDVMTLPVQVDELDLTSIKPGLQAEVTVDAISGKRFEGEVIQVSTVGTTTNGVTYYDAIVAVDNKDQQLKYGMTGTAEVLIQDKRNVLVLPVEALRIQRGAATVTVLREDGTREENVPVQIGIRSKTQVEVTGGLKEGDRVVIPTRQTTPNGTQQQIDALRQQFQQGGGMPQGGGLPQGGAPGGGGGAAGGGR